MAISFGSRALVRDIASGIFYLADDAFRVGEYIDCGKVKGTVEGFTMKFNLRLAHVTYLQKLRKATKKVGLAMMLAMMEDLEFEAEFLQPLKEFLQPLKLQGSPTFLKMLSSCASNLPCGRMFQPTFSARRSSACTVSVHTVGASNDAAAVAAAASATPTATAARV